MRERWQWGEKRERKCGFLQLKRLLQLRTYANNPLSTLHLHPQPPHFCALSLAYFSHYAAYLNFPLSLVFLPHTRTHTLTTLMLQSALSLIDLYFLIFTSATCLLSSSLLFSSQFALSLSHSAGVRSQHFYQMLAYSDWISKSWILLRRGIDITPLHTHRHQQLHSLFSTFYLCVCFAFTIYIKLFHCVCRTLLFLSPYSLCHCLLLMGNLYHLKLQNQ